MVIINDAKCNGCGICVDVCPTGALILQNNHAFIHQELCQECHNCIEACPQGAILVGENQPVSGEVIRIPANPEPALNTLTEPAERMPLREMFIPAIGSILLWTGRQIVPRIADLALGALDRRIQAANVVSTQYISPHRDDISTPTRPRGRGRRRRRRAFRKRMS